MLKYANEILSSKSGKQVLNKFICDFTQKKSAVYTPIAAMSSSIGTKFSLPERYKGSEKSVWVEYIQLAAEHKPLNLGQGFPDFAAPDYITKALADVATSSNVVLNQYTRGFGHPRLVNAIAKLYSKLIKRELNPMTEVLVTGGAYEALYAMISGHISPGDEAIVIEPFFDCYEPMIRTSGGTPVFIALKPKKTKGEITSADWVLDKEELAGLFNERTKFIILNTPHNPVGKVFTMEELQFIADLCKKWNVMCISDEVYEWIVYKPKKHIRMATLPGMWERTVTIGSAGKTFSVTGWKIGWAYGPANLLYNAMVVHQNCLYTCSTPLQEALAIGFELETNRLDSPDCYFNSLTEELVPKRKMIVDFLREVGMVPTIPEGGYFVVADWTPLGMCALLGMLVTVKNLRYVQYPYTYLNMECKVDLSGEKDEYKDYRFTKWMTKKVGLQGIPPSAFYSECHKQYGENYVRYCFIKKDENLKKAAEILRNWKAKM